MEKYCFEHIFTYSLNSTELSANPLSYDSSPALRRVKHTRASPITSTGPSKIQLTTHYPVARLFPRNASLFAPLVQYTCFFPAFT